MIKKIFNVSKLIKYYLIIIVVFGIIALITTVNVKQSNAEELITDQNNDGNIDLVDARILAPPATTNCPVCIDVNGDKVIDQKDIKLLNSKIAISSTTDDDREKPVLNSRFDINNDGAIDQADVDIAQNYIGQTVQVPAFGLDDPSELVSGFRANEVLVRFKNGTSDQAKQTLYSKYSLNVKSNLRRLPEAKLESSQDNVETLEKQIKAEPDVELVSKNHIAHIMTDDTNWVNQWGHKKIGIEYTWYVDTVGASGLNSSPVRVAVIDTGADYNHDDLQVNLSYRLRHNVINLVGTEFQDEDVSDLLGHGTHMAGIIGATANNQLDIAGLNWFVEIIPIKACTTAQGGCDEYGINAALEWITFLDDDKLPQVINMSFGDDTHDSTGYYDYYMDYLMEHKGVIMVASAGNSGDNDCAYPANHPGVVCVASTDQNDNLAVNSSGVIDAKVRAPGVDVLSTTPPDSIIDTNHNGIQSLNSDNTGGGTSMATAYVSGVTALCTLVAPHYTSERFSCSNYLTSGTTKRIDSYATVWFHNCKRFDYNNNNDVGGVDLQLVQGRVNRPELYEPKYDNFPNGRDGKIDLADYYVQRLMTGAQCQ